jgi:hypothetical protein
MRRQRIANTKEKHMKKTRTKIANISPLGRYLKDESLAAVIGGRRPIHNNTDTLNSNGDLDTNTTDT